MVAQLDQSRRQSREVQNPSKTICHPSPHDPKYSVDLIFNILAIEKITLLISYSSSFVNMYSSPMVDPAKVDPPGPCPSMLRKDMVSEPSISSSCALKKLRSGELDLTEGGPADFVGDEIRDFVGDGSRAFEGDGGPSGKLVFNSMVK